MLGEKMERKGRYIIKRVFIWNKKRPVNMSGNQDIKMAHSIVHFCDMMLYVPVQKCLDISGCVPGSNQNYALRIKCFKQRHRTTSIEGFDTGTCWSAG